MALGLGAGWAEWLALELGVGWEHARVEGKAEAREETMVVLKG